MQKGVVHSGPCNKEGLHAVRRICGNGVPGAKLFKVTILVELCSFVEYDIYEIILQLIDY